MPELKVLFETTVNTWGSRVRIFSDLSILLDNPTVLIPEVSLDKRDYFCFSMNLTVLVGGVAGTVRTHFSMQNIEKITFLPKVGKPPRRLFGPFVQTPVETMKLCYWRKEGNAIQFTVKKILYVEWGKPNQEFEKVEFVISIDEPEKFIEKIKELGFPVE